jgi:hypothetical protein
MISLTQQKDYETVSLISHPPETLMTLRYSLLAATLIAASSLTAAEETKPLFKEFMGINGHFHFKPELYRQTCNRVRNYHNISWDVKAPGEAQNIPFCPNGVNWKDHVYGKWQAAGLETDICLQFGGLADNKEQQERWRGKQDWCRAYAADIARFFGPSGEEKLCTSIEIGNEPGKRFDDAIFKEVFVAMTSGIREADPKVKILTPTVQARAADDYSKDVRTWFGEKDILPLYDALNVHVYAAIPRTDSTSSPWTRSFPEDTRATYLDVVDEMVAWRDAHAKGKEIWITEFGYDACTPEAMKQRTDWALKLNWQGVTDRQQAQYLIRSYFAFAQRDIDRAYIYFFNDDDKAGVHASAGLTRKFVPKMSFWAVKQLYETLGDYRFVRVVPGQDPKITVCEFTNNDKPATKIWAVWSPTGIDSAHKDGYQEVEVETTLTGMPGKPTSVVGMATADEAPPKIDFRQQGTTKGVLTVGESPMYLTFTP